MTGLYEYIREVRELYFMDVIEKARRYKNVVIYGAGRVAKPVFEILRAENIEIKCFAVSDVKTNENTFMGKNVVQIEKLHLIEEETLFIICTKYIWSSEIIALLQENGYCHYIIPPKQIDLFARDHSDMVDRPRMEITVKAGCKVNCRFCPQNLFLDRYYSEDSKPEYLSCENYKKCLHKLPLDTVIYFCGFSEPFLNPETIDMICYTHEQGYDMRLYTTFVGLAVKDFLRIKDIPFVYVVLHTPDDKEYANIPMTKEYFEVLDMALAQKKPNGDNFIDTANCQGIPHAKVLAHTEGKLRIMSELYDRAGNLKDNHQFRPLKEVKGAVYCSRVNKKLDYNVMLPDGTVVLCNADFGMEHVLGNLLKDSYEDIMNGERMNDILEALDNDKCGLLCRKCNFAINL